MKGVDNRMEENMEFLKERYELSMGKVREIAEYGYGDGKVRAYFAQAADFLCLMDDYYKFVRQNGLKEASLEELRVWNRKLYQDILPENYGSSFANPAYAAEQLGEEFGGLFSALYAEVRSMILPVTEQRVEELLIRTELFVEVYSAFEYEWQENQMWPSYESIRQILYWYVRDYSDITEEAAVKRQVDPENNYGVRVMMEADLSDIRYLYRYGEYVTDNEERTARFLASLPQEKIDLMADTYTEDYRMGFETANKDLSQKETVELYYAIGVERMMVKAIDNDDKALIWDKALMQRKLEVYRTALEKYKEKARLYAGPAVVETFGEKDFEPENKPQALHLSPEQQKLFVEYRSQAGAIQRNYIEDINEF